MGSCLEDVPDDLGERPFQLAFDPKYLPAAVDLRRWMRPVEDTGLLATSSAAALAGAIESLVFRSTQRHADVSRLFRARLAPRRAASPKGRQSLRRPPRHH